MTKRRRFTAEFKARVALDALRGDKTIQEIAAKRRVHPNQVSTWKRQAMALDEPELALEWTSGNMWPDVEFSGVPVLPVPLGDYPIVAVTLEEEPAFWDNGSADWDDDRESWEYDPGVGPPPCTPGPIDTYYVVNGNADILDKAGKVSS